MIDLENFSTELVAKNGIYFAKKESEISYPESGNEDLFQIEGDSFWFNHRNNCIVEIVRKFLKKELFFDIGGGNGFVAKGLQDKGIETVLIEPGIEGCRNAQNRNLKNIVCATLENAMFKNNTIQAVGLFDVVEHIEDDKEFLDSIYALLKQNGLVFISVPAFQYLWSNEDVDAGHFKRYTTKNLREKLINVGFKIEYSTYIFSVLPIAVYLFRTIPSKFGFNKKSNDLDKHISEHKKKTRIINFILNKIWEWELKVLKQGKKIGFGGSCFVVARKHNHIIVKK